MSRWQFNHNVEEQLDDEEIARILQEEEYELARQRQKEAAAGHTAGAAQHTTAQQIKKASGPVRSLKAKLGAAPDPAPIADEPLLLQSRCSAVSGTSVLNGSCYLYRSMFKFICVERGKEVVVEIYISSIEFITVGYAPKSSSVPRVVAGSTAEPNILQLYTRDKRIHTFFNFVDNKTFQKFYNIIYSIHKNHTAQLSVSPTTPSAVPSQATPVTHPPSALTQSQPAPALTQGPATTTTIPPSMMYPPAYPYPPHPIFLMPPQGPPSTQIPQVPRTPLGQPHDLSSLTSSDRQQQPFAYPQPFFYPPPPIIPAKADGPSLDNSAPSSAPMFAPYPPAYYPYPPMPFYPMPADHPSSYPFAAPLAPAQIPPYGATGLIPQQQPQQQETPPARTQSSNEDLLA